VEIKDHKAGTPAYTIRLSNGGEFVAKVSAKLNLANLDHRLGNAGFRGAAGAESRSRDYPSDV
jgi:hypothetical protein